MASFKNQLCMVAVVSFFVVSGSAQAAQITSCRTMASDAADEWANGRIEPAGSNEDAAPDQVVFISYGIKYLVPRYMPHDTNGKLPMLGELAREYNQVQGQEHIRCLTSRGFKFFIYPN